MGEYEESSEWADVVPIPQNEGGRHPLAAISYTEEYSEATSYLRAVMADNEMSERVLKLTEHIISMNPAHYTVWLYRAQTLKSLSHDPIKELDWLNDISLKHLKNYQIWHHRQITISQLSTLPETEPRFLARMLAEDAKNYHIWSYRQWLVRHFALWPAGTDTADTSTELGFVEDLLRADVRNNSAWNHRFYVIFGRDDGAAAPVPEAIWAREIAFAKAKIADAPQNQSAWNYLKGVLRRRGRGLDELEEFAGGFASLEAPDAVRSSHALDALAEIWAGRKERERAERALGLLAERYDPVRKNYWDYRRSLLGVDAEA